MKFLISGFAWMTMLLALISCIKQESTKLSDDQQVETVEAEKGSTSAKSDSTLITK
ncbi:hypothetical protein [Reichenbachiella sp.]|uniref:hypothetical protein n=1 Tax=Reichenbachiella sp. TaxID=2184521 RepID=UPI003BB1C7E7